MSTQVEPLPKTVKKAVRRNTSSTRHMAPVVAALFQIGMFFAIVCACGVGAFILWRGALEDPRFRMDGETLAMAGAVRECPESVEEIRRIGLSFNGRSILDPTLIGDLQQAYQGSVWVKKVTRMRRSFPNRIDLELLLRIPAAQIKSGRHYWLIDQDGVLLPVEGAVSPFPNLPEIIGVSANMISGRPRAGEQWNDEGVRGGLGIMRAFWASPLSEALPVHRVVVNTGVFRSEDGRQKEIRRRFEIVTEGGAVVRWGTYNSGMEGDELTSAEKMWHLEELLRTNEAAQPGVCFDVRTRLPGFSLIR